jgi:hypothetical protein
MAQAILVYIIRDVIILVCVVGAIRRRTRELNADLS